MSLETSIRESCLGLSSERATERKKCAETLNTFLSGTAAPSMLTENTKNKIGFSWDNLFEHANDYILKETENFEKSKTFQNTIKPLATSLLHKTVASSKKDGKAYIKCEKITNACLYILKDRRLAKAIGDTYLNLLYKYVISNEYYVGFISPQTWEELLEVCMCACGSSNYSLDYFVKLRLVWLIILNSSKSCQLLGSLRDVLPKLQREFLKSSTDKKIQDVMVEISLLLVQNLSFEFRLTMCQFTEATLGSIIKFYDQSMDKRKALLFKLLHIVVVIHHPQGKLENEEGSLACNWQTWNRHLHSITEIIELEVKVAQKSLDSKFRIKDDYAKKYTHFFNLAAAVFYQVFNKSLQRNVDEGCSGSKRQKILNQNSFTDLIEEFRTNHVPWLGIISDYVKHYGNTITESEYTALLHILDNYITNNNNGLHWEIFEELSCLVLKNLLTSKGRPRNELKSDFLSLWNSCVRHSTLSENVHKAMHSILQYILICDVITYQNVQSLMKTYYEKAMPVTDYSVKTLTYILQKFFSKYNKSSDKQNCFAWLIHSDTICCDMINIQDLFIRLISNENIERKACPEKSSQYDNLYDVLFNTLEYGILFNEFQLSCDSKAATESFMRVYDVSNNVDKHIRNGLEIKLTQETEKFKINDVKLTEYANFIKIVLIYCDCVLKFTNIELSDFVKSKLYNLLKISLKLLFASLTQILIKSDERTEDLELMKIVHSIMIGNYTETISRDIRLCIETDFFQSAYTAINDRNTNIDEDQVMEVDDIDENLMDQRRNCIQLLAAYCRTDTRYRQDILDLILNNDLYTFRHISDIKCAFQSMSVLIDSSIKNQPYESVLGLMLSMCQRLFRNSEATCGLLNILLLMLEDAWPHLSSTMKTNCSIMIDTYLQRCKCLYYPPNVAALIYRCVAALDELNRKGNENYRSKYKESLMVGTTGVTHSLRLYSCYLLNMLAAVYTAADIEIHVNESLKLFTIDAAGKTEEILKDELANRTLTVLHCFFALAQAKKALTNDVITAILKVHKLKSLDKSLVKKVLDKIMNLVSLTGIDVYFKDNILALLHFWFSEKYKLDDLPVYLLGFSNLNEFIELNIKWLIPAEILWCKKGNIHESDALKKIQCSTNKTVESYIESCFSNIIILALPYIVVEKYNLQYEKQEKALAYIESVKNAENMFRQTNQIIGSKFGDLFFEKMGDLVMLSTMHIADYEDIKNVYAVDVPQLTERYYYPKKVFDAILKYFGELTNSDIMCFLSEHQPMIISKIILKLWTNVLRQTFLESKTLAVHTFITFIESIKLGYNADHFVCNFACNSLLHAIKSAKEPKELQVWLVCLQILFRRFLPTMSELLRDTLPLAVALLKIKKEEGFEDECNTILELLVSKDDTDSLVVASQGQPRKSSTSSYLEFSDTLKKYVMILTCPSYEVISGLYQFLKANKDHSKNLSISLKFKGFSEDCKRSLLHEIIGSLNRILITSSDNKIIIEACNCLAIIGTYDLKTLVMVAPHDSQAIVDLKPAQYFAMVVMKHLTEVLVDKDPAVVSKVIATLSRLLMYREGKIAFDLKEVNPQVLKQFKPAKSNNILAKFQVIEAKFEVYRRLDLWLPIEPEDYSTWICRITGSLLDIINSSENYLANLKVVCKSKPRLCQSILPPLIGLLLSILNENQVAFIGAQLNSFFNHFWETTFNGNSSENSDGGTKKSNDINHDDKMIIQDVLGIVNFLRLQRIHYMKRPDEIESLNYLRLQYDMVAWAAAITDDSLASIYYGELWANSRNGGVPPSSPEATAKMIGGENLHRIFRKCFTSIGDTYAIDGCGSGHLTSEQEKRKHLINTGQYSDALLFHDIALSHGDSQNDISLEYGVIRSLHKSGMHHLALQYIKTLPENDKFDDVKYECLSFLGDWSVIVDTNETENKLRNPHTNMSSLLKELRYACLKDCLSIQLASQEYENKLVLPLNRAKLSVSKLSQKLNMDNCQSVYNIVSQLQMFNDIEHYYAVRCNKLPIKELMSRWQVDNLAPFQDFKHVESLLSQRCVILDHASKSFSHLQNDIVNLQLRYAELALTNERIQLSQRLLALAKRTKTSTEVALVEGQIAWSKGHKDIALSLISNITNNEGQDVTLTAAALRQYGAWMAESKSENARDIIDKYLKRSLEVLGAGENAGIRHKVYYDIAKFADTEYKQVVSYMKSPIFENKVKCVENMKGTVSSLRSVQTETLTRDEKKALMTNEKLSILDENEIRSTIAEKKRFLDLAMKYYLLSLKRDEENNLSVFRIISLWLDNPEFEFENNERDSFTEQLNAVPSRKYLPVLPQLAPRLTNADDGFANNLKKIITRCAKEHPHHTLPTLFGLKNSDKDKKILNASAGVGGASRAGGAGRSRGGSEEPRVLAAAHLLQELATSDSELATIIEQMDRMCDAIISFANFEAKSKETKQAVPKAETISKLKNLTAIPIPTITLSIRNDCNYTEFPAIVSFDKIFELVGGINCPKKILCRGSDGKDRTLLIKGEDDLRQDAVMQQVFNIVNTLLEINPLTSRNKLLIRTYKVVPLSRRSGVLEWCEETVPLGYYLVGTSSMPGAHSRYRPKDISCLAARSKLTNCHTSGKSSGTKLHAFLSILNEFKPVFHYFFTEHYLDPVTWYERRLAYTKSVATSSMVGYILGLGDRHVQNILIDKKTAEVVHIDFGIAFDQGRALPTPETIPFRLTQDLLAGFGCSGVEGIFRRSCENTMQLLRDNYEALLTILEVLLCDPLYSWTITPAEAKRKQNILSTTPRDSAVLSSTAQPSSGLAERALLAVSSKLSGTEGGVAGGVAVPGQVARLLHAATDPANLSRLYPGWQPYL